MEWAAPKENFYALIATILNKNLTADKALKELNVVEYREKNQIPEERKPTKEELQRLHDEGVSQRKLAEMYDVSQCTVSQWFIKLNVEVRYRKFKTIDNNELIEYYVNQQFSVRNTAIALGVSTTSVFDAIDRLGLRRRNRSEARKLYLKKEN